MTPVVCLVVASLAFSNWVLDATFDADGLGRVMETADAFFAGRETPYSWLVLPHQAWLARALESSGHSLREEVQCMALPLDTHHPAQALQTEIRRVDSEDGLRIAFSIDDSYAEFSAQQIEERVQHNIPELADPDQAWFLVYVEGTAAAVTSLHFLEGGRIAYLSGATTLPGYRNRGLYKALLRHRLALASQRGALWGYHAVTDTSAPILHNHGFQSLSRLRVYSRSRATTIS
jgi:GNAT superfamily N-acetyltransferase